jgi:hypothetical protein
MTLNNREKIKEYINNQMTQIDFQVRKHLDNEGKVK